MEILFLLFLLILAFLFFLILTFFFFIGRTFAGRVDSIMAGTGSVFSLFPPENATGNYVKVVQRIPVKIVLDKGSDPDHLLRVGMSVQPTIAVRN